MSLHPVYSGNMYGKFREVWKAVFKIRHQTERQTYRQTDALIAILRTRIGGKVMSAKRIQSKKK